MNVLFREQFLVNSNYYLFNIKVEINSKFWLKLAVTHLVSELCHCVSLREAASHWSLLIFDVVNNKCDSMWDLIYPHLNLIWQKITKPNDIARIFLNCVWFWFQWKLLIFDLTFVVMFCHKFLWMLELFASINILPLLLRLLYRSICVLADGKMRGRMF